MNTITNIEVNQKQLNIINKAGIYFYEQLARLKPKKLYDCRKEVILNKDALGHGGMVVGILERIYTKKSSNGIDMTFASVYSESNKQSVRLVWFHTTYPAERYEDSIGKRVLVFGKVDYDDYMHQYKFTSPILFTDYCEKYEGKIIPAYKKYRGMSDDYYSEIICNSSKMDLEEPFTKGFREKYNLLSLKDMSNNLHNPKDIYSLQVSYRQIDIEDMIYFSTHLQRNAQAFQKESPRIIKHEVFDRAIKELPFELTEGQRTALYGLKENIENGKELNALVQGDVSCGKSIVAYLLLLLFAENGYQGALLAPTIVLASQHYNEAASFFEKYGYKVGFLNNTVKRKERAGLIKDLKEGNIDILVGTHAVVADEVEFKNLGAAVIDEEQRFGVTCREKIKTKAKGNPIVYVSMSATPIPRTLATCIYGEGTGIYSIKSMPNGRKPVDTVITDSFQVPEILKSELKAGRQGYVVCALIDDNEEEEENPIVSVEKTKKAYEKALPEYRIEALTGKTKEADIVRIMQEYKEGKIHVLISTTVIEVGVNNPNSSVIIIQNAERFGLSTLHQLRGRVRRGTYKPYCILISEAKDNERLKALVSTEDGFKLSEMDLNLRKSGNLIGTEQSGRNHFVELLINKPKIYEYSRRLAMDLISRGEDERFVTVMDKIYSGAQ